MSGVAAGFNAPISGVFFAVETVLRRQPTADGDSSDDSGVTVAMVSCLLCLDSTARALPAFALLHERRSHAECCIVVSAAHA